jgi:hypothetical protein
MQPEGIIPVIPASEWPHNYALDCKATGVLHVSQYEVQFLKYFLTTVQSAKHAEFYSQRNYRYISLFQLAYISEDSKVFVFKGTDIETQARNLLNIFLGGFDPLVFIN